MLGGKRKNPRTAHDMCQSVKLPSFCDYVTDTGRHGNDDACSFRRYMPHSEDYDVAVHSDSP